MKAISLDMSTSAIGYAIWEDDTLIRYGKLKGDKKLDWEGRVMSFLPLIYNMFIHEKIEKVVVEDVPLFTRCGQKSTLVKLGAVRGMLLCVMRMAKIKQENFESIRVDQWRKAIGINTGDKHRDVKKVQSLRLANKMFSLDLNIVFTKNGTYSEEKSDDDVADAILLYASTREKYRRELI